MHVATGATGTILARQMHMIMPGRCPQQHRAESLDPEQPGAHRRHHHIGGDLQPAGSLLHGNGGEVEDHGNAADDQNGGQGLRKGRGEGEQDALLQRVFAGQHIGRNHRLAMARTCRMENTIGEGEERQQPARIRAVAEAAQRGNELLVEFGLIAGDLRKEAADQRIALQRRRGNAFHRSRRHLGRCLRLTVRSRRFCIAVRCRHLALTLTIKRRHRRERRLGRGGCSLSRPTIDDHLIDEARSNVRQFRRQLPLIGPDLSKGQCDGRIKRRRLLAGDRAGGRSIDQPRGIGIRGKSEIDVIGRVIDIERDRIGEVRRLFQRQQEVQFQQLHRGHHRPAGAFGIFLDSRDIFLLHRPVFGEGNLYHFQPVDFRHGEIQFHPGVVTEGEEAEFLHAFHIYLGQLRQFLPAEDAVTVGVETLDGEGRIGIIKAENLVHCRGKAIVIHHQFGAGFDKHVRMCRSPACGKQTH